MAIGRPKGSKDKKPRRFYHLARGEAIPAGKKPLEYMLAVMNDVTADLTRRDRMAVAAAPYLHARISQQETDEAGVPKGKKAARAYAANIAGRGSDWGDDLSSEVN